MVSSSVFYQRRDQHCKLCEFWRGVCLKGHKLSSPAGCPVRKFEPVEGADYAPDKLVEVHAPALTGCCGQPAGENQPESKPPAVRWEDVVAQFAKSLTEWVKQGLPLVPHVVHMERVGQCKKDDCGEYRDFYCSACKCLVYVKGKLATEDCPKRLWKR